MSSQQPHAVIFKEEDIHLFRLRKITGYVCTRVIYIVFCEGMSARPPGLSLFDYCQSKGVKVKKFKNTLSAEQIQRIEGNPDGNTFDVTLLYRCLQWACDNVADKYDDTWKEGNGSLESLLTALKNRRNELFHEEPAFSKQEFIDKTEELRKLLIETLMCAQIRYGISRVFVDQIVNEVNTNINLFRDKPLVPLDFADYKKQLFFLEQGSYVMVEGRKLLCKLYGEWDIVNPASLLANVVFKVNMIYTEMLLQDESIYSMQNKLSYEDVLKGIVKSNKDPIILVEGLAGVGKTTFTKKILSDWISARSTMTDLNSYDLLIYTECRNHLNKSFKELISSLLPEMASSFQDDDFVNVALDQKILVIVDGLDELNKSSMRLVKELLELKKNFGITIIATTRPDRVETYYHLVNSHQIKTKHIKLNGIPKEKRDVYVVKYHKELQKNNLSKQDISGLRNFLKRREDRLDELFRLPYNLTLLTILFVNDPTIIGIITTAPELYWQIHQRCLSKLKERLRNYEVTQHQLESVIDRKINNFIAILSYEALVGLKNDSLNLSIESFKHLEDACVHEDLPLEEMTGAFLKKIVMRTPRGFETRYTFPHKGLQEFFGAHFAFKEAACETESQHAKDVVRDIEQVMKKHKVAAEKSQAIIRYASETMNRNVQYATTSTSTGASAIRKATVVRDILEKLHGSTPLKMEKYQNLFSTLIGLFYVKKDKIKDSIKLEVLQLLQESGVRKRKDWLRILDSVKCDKFVASFISQQSGILEGDIEIEDHTIFAYISLLNALQPPLATTRQGRKKIMLELNSDTDGFQDLLGNIIKLQLEVRDLILHHDFKHPTQSPLYGDAISQVLQRCDVMVYRGSVTPHMTLPNTIRSLYVSVADVQCYIPLKIFFQTKPQLNYLRVCVYHGIDSSILSPLPEVTQYYPDLYVPDITLESQIANACQVVKKLQPVHGKKMFDQIYFPRAKLCHRLMKELLRGMRGVVVSRSVVFPSACRPSSPEEEQEIQELAENEFSCRGVEWGWRDIDEW